MQLNNSINKKRKEGPDLKILFRKAKSFTIFTKFTALVFVIMPLYALPTAAISKMEVRDSIVKIYCVQNQPDYDNPWDMHGPEQFSGSGCVIDGNRILTNAHVVSDHTFIQVRLHGQSQKYTAKVIAISHEADLALLTVEDASFFSKIKPLKFGELPEIEQEVIVCGFPEGGDTMSTTKGVVSRIENQQYAHSWINLLAGQLDAAINSGNSGGPVIVGDRIVGVVMQSLSDSDNIGYMVPVPIIKHFLTDLEDGQYDGFPEDGITIQPIENRNLKRMYGLKNSQSGALVVSVTPGSPAENMIFPGDILLSIDGHRIADDCTVEFRPKERTGCGFYVKQHQVGEDAVYKVYRNGREKTVKLSLTKSWGNNMLVPMMKYDVRPTYFIYGGLVFCPLTLNYIKTWGKKWLSNAPSNLLNYFLNGQVSQAGEHVVIIIKVLPSQINNGFDGFINQRVVEVNGQKIRNLKELIQYTLISSEDPFVVFKTENNQTLAFDRRAVDEEQTELLKIYRITEDRSSDLQVAANNGGLVGEKTAKIGDSTTNKIQ
jgi:S1-C subfamily serine protease